MYCCLSLLALCRQTHGQLPCKHPQQCCCLHAAGEVALPGGKRETGEDDIQTALRESQEETGLNPQLVQARLPYHL